MTMDVPATMVTAISISMVINVSLMTFLVAVFQHIAGDVVYSVCVLFCFSGSHVHRQAVCVHRGVSSVLWCPSVFLCSMSLVLGSQAIDQDDNRSATAGGFVDKRGTATFLSDASRIFKIRSQPCFGAQYEAEGAVCGARQGAGRRRR